MPSEEKSLEGIIFLPFWGSDFWLFSAYYERSVFMGFNANIEIDELRRKGYGYKKIASELGLSPNTVKSYLRRYSEAENPLVRCLCCGAVVNQTPHRKAKKFCSDKCRMAWWNAHPERISRKAFYSHTCQQCGATFESYGNDHRKYCSRACYTKARQNGGGGDE